MIHDSAEHDNIAVLVRDNLKQLMKAAINTDTCTQCTLAHLIEVTMTNLFHQQDNVDAKEFITLMSLMADKVTKINLEAECRHEVIQKERMQ